MLSDLRYTIRQLAKSPGFTTVVVLTLATGIGANTAIFSGISALYLKPLPYNEPNRIVQIDEKTNTGGDGLSCGGVFMDWEDHSTQLESIAAFAAPMKNLTGAGEPVRLPCLEVSAQYLNVLQVSPQFGRNFTPAEDAPGGNRHVTILTHHLWQTRLHGDPAILGKAIRIDAENYTVIGILPANALFAINAEFLIPAAIRVDAWKQGRDNGYNCGVIGRLKPGATVTQAEAELNTAKQALNTSYPTFKQPWGVSVRPLQKALFGDSQPVNLMLFAAAALILLIACANVANLLLARGTIRQGEIAIRLSLGASRWRIVRQLLMESLLLATAGGLVGVWLAALTISPMGEFGGINSIPGLTVSIDHRVLIFTVGATLVTCLLFGLLPALSASRSDLQASLKESTRSSTGGSARRLQSAFIISEIALTIVLLIVVGLLVRSLQKALNADAGFNSDNVVLFSLSQPGTKAQTNDHRVRFTREIMDRLAQIPGVSKVGETSTMPMNGTLYMGDFVSREDQPGTRNNLNAGFDSVNGDFFQAVGIPLLRGRFFTEADNSEKAPRTIIINNVLAHLLFADENPVGQLLHFRNEIWEIIGIVADTRRYQLDIPPQPQVYFPEVHFPWATTYVIRAQVPPLTLSNEIRRAVQSVDPEQPIDGLQTLKQSVTDSLRFRKIILTMLGIFALIALLLASIGIYGVTAYTVAQRTRELGIRIALGAQANNVLWQVLRQSLKLAGIGAVIGLAIATLVARPVSIFFYDVKPYDALTFLSVPALLIAVTVIACLLPARRATKVNPIEALRSE